MCLDKPKEKPVKHVKTHPIFDNVHSVREILSEMILLALLLSHFMQKSNDQGIDESACLRLSGLGYPGLCGLQNETPAPLNPWMWLQELHFPCYAMLPCFSHHVEGAGDHLLI
jgi:hypothetical protein